MRRYLFVLDMDLLAVDEELDLQPINYLVARQEQEPCEVVVMSLVRSRQARLPAMELALGARSGKFPVRPSRIMISVLPLSIAWTWPYGN